MKLDCMHVGVLAFLISGRMSVTCSGLCISTPVRGIQSALKCAGYQAGPPCNTCNLTCNLPHPLDQHLIGIRAAICYNACQLLSQSDVERL